jgi:hypothetical protein
MPGESQTYTISPSSGYQVESVLVDGSSVGPVSSYTFGDVRGNHTIGANFSRIVSSPSNRTLKISKKGTGGGAVTTSPAGTVFPTGTQVTLTAVSEGTSAFVGWSGSCSGKDPTCIVNMNLNRSVTATFEKVANPSTQYKVFLPFLTVAP